MKPIIHLYTICWNEEKLLAHFFRYYDPIVEEYHFYDDGSDDGTLEILQKHPKVHVHAFETTENSYVLSAQKLHETHWKKSIGKADWVIITAVDEFLYHPALLQYLAKCSAKKVTAIPAIGFQMVSEFYPKSNIPVINQISSGAYFEEMNKLSIFNPNAIEKTNYKTGRHSANPKGRVKYPWKDVLLNLHYKYLSFDMTLARHEELNRKLREGDKKEENNFGHRYRWGAEQLQKEWDFFQANSIDDVFDQEKLSGYLKNKEVTKWWRKRWRKKVRKKVRKKWERWRNRLKNRLWS